MYAADLWFRRVGPVSLLKKNCKESYHGLRHTIGRARNLRGEYEVWGLVKYVACMELPIMVGHPVLLIGVMLLG